jgi:hypothetical protein
MPFVKGQSGNNKGRPAGVPNKVTARTRELVEEIVESELPRLKSGIRKMKPGERAAVLIRLLNYILPRLQSAQVEIEGPGVAGINEVELDQRIKELMKQGGYSNE